MTVLDKLKEMRTHISFLRLEELDQQAERRADDMPIIAAAHGGAASAFDIVTRMIDDVVKEGDVSASSIQTAMNYFDEVLSACRSSVASAYPNAKFNVVLMTDGISYHTRVVDLTSAQGGVYLHEFSPGVDHEDIAREVVNALSGTRFGRAGAVRK